MPTFSVVATVKENHDILARFAAYYTRLGAADIHMLYDGDAAEFEARGLDRLRGGPVRITLCDEAFWQAQGMVRPPVLSDRQRFLYPWAYGALETDWLLICDADEFVLDRVPMADFLALLPDEAESVVIPPAEAVWGPGEDIRTPFGSTWFRRPHFEGKLASAFFSTRLYGRVGPMFRYGILSHIQGKQVLRAGRQFDLINVHNARRGGHVVSQPAKRFGPEAGSLELAHFDAIGYDRWVEKFERAVRDMQRDPDFLKPIARPRQRQIRAIARAIEDPARLERLFRQLYVLDDRQIAQLARKDMIFQTDVF